MIDDGNYITVLTVVLVNVYSGHSEFKVSLHLEPGTNENVHTTKWRPDGPFPWVCCNTVINESESSRGELVGVPCSRPGIPWWLSGKESVCIAGDPGSILGSGRSPGGGNGSPVQYSCLGSPKDCGL